MPEHSTTHTIPITNPAGPIGSPADHAAGGRRGARHEAAARWTARVVVAAGAWCLLAIPLDLVAPSLVRVVSALFGLVNVPVAANVFTGVMFAVVGSALVVRKRAALWFVALGFQAGWLVVAALVTVLRTWSLGHVPRILLDTPIEIGMFWVEVVTAVVLLGVLWSIRGSFTARLAPGSFRRAVVNLGIGVAVAAIVGIALTELFPGSLQGQRRQVIWPLRTALGLMPDPDSPFYAGTGERWVAAVIGGLSTVALLRAGYVLLRSSRMGRRLSPADELQLRRLLIAHGDSDSLGYFATRRDKAVLFDPSGRAAVTYRVEAGCSLASADPIGDRSAWPAAIERWLAEAREYGWATGVLAASEHGATAYRRAGLRVLALGDEAVIDVAALQLASPALRPVRQAVRRVQRADYTVEVRRHGELAADEFAELAACAERWRGDEPERGFSMTLGRLGDATDRRCVMVTAHDANGVLRALLSFVPWGSSGLSLDLMRRDPTAPNGVIEFMVCGVADAAGAFGVQRVSLNFAMFREVFAASERLGAGPVVRLTARLLSAASRWWQLETLYRANAKYQPRWQPRYLCYADTLQLNRVLIAAGIAEGHLPNVRLSADELAQAAPAAELVEEIEEIEEVAPGVTTVPSPASAATGHDPLASGVAAVPERAGVTAAGADPVPVASTDVGDSSTTPAGIAAARSASVVSMDAGAAAGSRLEQGTAIVALRQRHAGLAAGSATGEHVVIAGRVLRIRPLGRLCFAVVGDGEDDGDAEIQVMLRPDRAGAFFGQWQQLVGVGDQVSCVGEVVATRTGELTVDVSSWTMSTRCPTSSTS